MLPDNFESSDTFRQSASQSDGKIQANKVISEMIMNQMCYIANNDPSWRGVKARAFLLDGADFNSTRAVIQAGLPPGDVWVVNDSPNTVMKIMSAPPRHRLGNQFARPLGPAPSRQQFSLLKDISRSRGLCSVPPAREHSAYLPHEQLRVRPTRCHQAPNVRHRNDCHHMVRNAG